MGKVMAEMVRKKRPRTCVGCMEESPKRQLIRIVRTTDGDVMYDPTGRAPGRGAYVCLNAECIKLAKRKNSLARSLKVATPTELYQQLEDLCAIDQEKEPSHDDK